MKQRIGSKLGKGVRQGCILSPCLSNLYAEYIMQNARLDEAQAGVKIAGRNMNKDFFHFFSRSSMHFAFPLRPTLELIFRYHIDRD